MKINHISISREQCWKECQQAYKFRYHLEVIPNKPQPIYFAFGKIVHVAIEHYTRCKGERKIEDIAKDVLSGKIELQPGEVAPPLDPEYKNKLTKHLQNFMKLSDKIGFDGEIEWKFKIDMDGQGRCMTGFIDRMIIKDGIYSLIDWKTTKPSPWRKNSRTITTDLQLQCYCYVVWKEFKVDPKNIQAALMFLDDNKLIGVRFSENVLKTVPERLLSVYKAIENKAPEEVYGNVGQHCQRCIYNDMCSFYRGH